jgi:hypothetical protein
MNLYLIVKTSFQKYVRGDIITDATQIEKILESGLDHCVTKIIPAAKNRG